MPKWDTFKPDNGNDQPPDIFAVANQQKQQSQQNQAPDIFQIAQQRNMETYNNAVNSYNSYVDALNAAQNAQNYFASQPKSGNMFEVLKPGYLAGADTEEGQQHKAAMNADLSGLYSQALSAMQDANGLYYGDGVSLDGALDSLQNMSGAHNAMLDSQNAFNTNAYAWQNQTRNSYKAYDDYQQTLADKEKGIYTFDFRGTDAPFQKVKLEGDFAKQMQDALSGNTANVGNISASAQKYLNSLEQKYSKATGKEAADLEEQIYATKYMLSYLDSKAESYDATNINDYLYRAEILANKAELSDAEKEEAEQMQNALTDYLMQEYGFDEFDGLEGTKNLPDEAQPVVALWEDLSARLSPNTTAVAAGLYSSAVKPAIDALAAAGLDTNDYASRANRRAALAQNDAPVAFTAGSIAGNMAKIAVEGQIVGGAVNAFKAGVSGASAAAGAASTAGSSVLSIAGNVAEKSIITLPKLPTVVQNGLMSAAIFATDTAYSNIGNLANGTLTAGQYAADIGISGVSSFAGGVASALVSSGWAKMLLKNNAMTFANAWLGRFLSSSTFAAANTAGSAMQAAVNDKQMTAGQVAESMVTGMLFSAVTSFTQTMQATNASKKAIDGILREYAENLNKFGGQYGEVSGENFSRLIDEGVITPQQANEIIMGYTQILYNLKHTVNGTYLEGQQEYVDNVNSLISACVDQLDDAFIAVNGVSLKDIFGGNASAGAETYYYAYNGDQIAAPAAEAPKSNDIVLADNAAVSIAKNIDAYSDGTIENIIPDNQIANVSSGNGITAAAANNAIQLGGTVSDVPSYANALNAINTPTVTAPTTATEPATAIAEAPQEAASAIAVAEPIKAEKAETAVKPVIEAKTEEAKPAETAQAEKKTATTGKAKAITVTNDNVVMSVGGKEVNLSEIEAMPNTAIEAVKSLSDYGIVTNAGTANSVMAAYDSYRNAGGKMSGNAFAGAYFAAYNEGYQGAEENEAIQLIVGNDTALTIPAQMAFRQGITVANGEAVLQRSPGLKTEGRTVLANYNFADASAFKMAYNVGRDGGSLETALSVTKAKTKMAKAEMQAAWEAARKDYGVDETERTGQNLRNEQGRSADVDSGRLLRSVEAGRGEPETDNGRRETEKYRRNRSLDGRNEINKKVTLTDLGASQYELGDNYTVAEQKAYSNGAKEIILDEAIEVDLGKGRTLAFGIKSGNKIILSAKDPNIRKTRIHEHWHYILRNWNNNDISNACFDEADLQGVQREKLFEIIEYMKEKYASVAVKQGLTAVQLRALAVEETLCNLKAGIPMSDLYAGNSIDSEAISYNEREILKNVTENVNETEASSDGIRFSLPEDVKKSMTMQQCKRLMDIAFNVSGMKDYGYKNADAWINSESSDDVATILENYEATIKILEKDENYLNEAYTAADLIDAYKEKALVGKGINSSNISRIDTSKSTGFKDDRFYSPREIKDIKNQYEVACKKASGPDKESVLTARKNVLLASHNSNIAEELGITAKELNAKLNTWSKYSSKAKEVSEKINSGSAMENRWVGIQNSSIISTATITDNDIASCVKQITGTSTEFQRNYIGRTILAIDCHTDWSELSFNFVNARYVDGKRALGTYSDAKRSIEIGNNYSLNTVAHEMGHALDHKWTRDLIGGGVGSGIPLSENVHIADRISNANERQFVNNFRLFMDGLTEVNDIRSSYTNEGTEIFARFVAEFVEWTSKTAGNNFFNETNHYGDRFTEKQFIEFAKLLQEKSAIDIARAASSENRTASANYSERISIPERVNKEIDLEADGSNYSKLAEDYFNGDKTHEQELQSIVDEAAKEAGAYQDTDGNPLHLYHGTENNFFSFDIGRKLKHGRVYGYGVYLSSNKEFTKHYSRNVRTIDAYVIADNLATHDDKKITDSKIREIIDTFNNYGIEFSILGKDFEDSREYFIKKYNEELNEFDSYLNDVTILKDIGRNLIRPTDMSNEDFADIYAATMEMSGYQGIKSADEFVIWDSKRVKSAAPVEVDDNNAVIDIDNRFNTNINDIRLNIADTADTQLAETAKKVDSYVAKSKKHIFHEFMDYAQRTPTEQNIHEAAAVIHNRYDLKKVMSQESVEQRMIDIANELDGAEDNAAKYYLAKSKADELAADIITSKVADKDTKETFADFKKILRGETNGKFFVRETKSAGETEIKELRSRARGHGYFLQDAPGENSAVKAESIEKAYIPLYEKYQYLLDQRGGYMYAEEDQLAQILDILDYYKAATAKPYEGRLSNAVDMLSNDIMEQLFNSEREAPGAEALSQEREEMMQAYYKHIMVETLASAEEYRQKAMEAVEGRWAKHKEREALSAERTQVLKLMQRAAKLKTLPEFEEQIDSIIDGFNIVTTRMIKGVYEGDRIGNLKTADIPESVAIIKTTENGKKVYDPDSLKKFVYELMAANPDFHPDERTLKYLNASTQKNIADLSRGELRELHNSLLNVMNEIKTHDKMLADDYKATVHELSAKAYRDIDSSKGIELSADSFKQNLKSSMQKGWRGFVVNSAETPVRFAHEITGYHDDDPFYVAVKNLSNGGTKAKEYQYKAWKQFDSVANDTDYLQTLGAGDKARPVTITGMRSESQGGGMVTVKMTRDAMISLYLHAMNKDNLKHIEIGGMVIPDFNLLKAGRIDDAFSKGTCIKMQKSEIDKFLNANMETKDKNYASKLYHYFNDTSKNSLNDVSKILVGYEVAGVTHYFPINVNPNFAGEYSAESFKMDASITNMGSLKSRTGGMNAINLYGATDVLTKAINDHSKYVGYAIPVRDFSKLYGDHVWGINADGTVFETDREGNPVTKNQDSVSENNKGIADIKVGYDAATPGSLRELIERKWSNDAHSYIDRMMGNVQGGVRVARGKWYGSMMSHISGNAAGGVLMLNASVSMVQAASYPTAAAVIGWEPLAYALAHPNTKIDLAEFAKICPYYWDRSKGFGKVSMAEAVQGKKATPKALDWITAMDLATTRTLIIAAKHYAINHADEFPAGMSLEQRWAETYTNIIKGTQPIYDVMERPHLLRSDDNLERSLFMFMTQRLQNFNIAYDSAKDYSAKTDQLKQAKYDYEHADGAEKESAKEAYENAQKSQKTAAKKCYNSWMALTVANAVVPVMKLAYYAMFGKMKRYKDDDDKMTFKSFTTAFAGDAILSWAGMIPGLGTLLEAGWKKLTGQKYYGVEAVNIGLVNDLIDAFQKTKISDIGAVFTGDKSVIDEWIDTKSLLFTGLQIFKGIPATNINNILDALLHRSLQIVLDKEDADYWYRYITVKSTAQGKAKQDAADAYINYINGDKAAYKGMHNRIVKDLMRNGNYSKAEAEEKYAGIMKGIIEADYEAGNISSIKAAGLLVSLADMDEDAADDYIYKTDYAAEVGSCNSAKKARDYYELAEPEGIKIDTWDEFYSYQSNGYKGDDGERQELIYEWIMDNAKKSEREFLWNYVYEKKSWQWAEEHYG